MKTHPKYPHVSKDTGSLIRSLVIVTALFITLTIAVEILKL